MTEDDVEDLILGAAPVDWLRMMEDQRTGAFAGTLTAAREIARQNKRTVAVGPLGMIEWPQRSKPVLPKS
jgi:hypothetical protein